MDRYIVPGANKITSAGLAGDMRDLNAIDKTSNQLPLNDDEEQYSVN